VYEQLGREKQGCVQEFLEFIFFKQYRKSKLTTKEIGNKPNPSSRISRLTSNMLPSYKIFFLKKKLPLVGGVFNKNIFDNNVAGNSTANLSKELSLINSFFVKTSVKPLFFGKNAITHLVLESSISVHVPNQYSYRNQPTTATIKTLFLKKNFFS
jgi:hypothetical protein